MYTKIQSTLESVVGNLNMLNKSNIFSRSSSNSEANASELLEDLEEMRVVSWSVSNYCMYIVLTPISKELRVIIIKTFC